MMHAAIYAGARAGAPAPGLHDIAHGNNGAYRAKRGWDACTGLGTPDGAALLALMQTSAT
jgi:kumamolisin